MPDPQSVNIGLNLPTRGSDVGVWDTSVNGNSNSLDGLFGGVQSFSLSTATTATLTAPAGFTATPGAGPVQSQNAVLRFTGALSGNAIFTLPAPGYYIIDNRTTGNFYVQFRAVGAGEVAATPQGCPVKIFNDGTNIRFVDMPMPGTIIDLCGVTALPTWIGACTVAPWLICDGTVHNISSYTFLGNQLLGTFGGNGSTTFAVPDCRNRFRVAVGGARITAGGSGIDGATMGSVGGNELMQQHNHGTNESPHTHTIPNVGNANIAGGGVGSLQTAAIVSGTTNSGATSTGLTIQNAGSGGSQNMPPTIVTGIALIKT